MTVSSAPQLLDLLRQLRLLTPDQLAALPASADPRTLAKDLVQRGWLTPFQVNQLFTGKGRELLLGSYVLMDKLGEGGMGAVFQARNWKLGQIVALKLIRPERLSGPDAVRRFQREIRAAAQLDHPNIVRALDADEVNGTHFFVMEFAEGTDLSKVVKKSGPLTVDQACDYVRQAALGLQHAYERGLVHRDIKPSNLLLTKMGAVKILDMGLARLESGGDDDGSGTLTETGAIMGTPDYLAPEQARASHSADIRADLYALGCSLHYLLAGRVPFPGGTVGEKLLKHQLDEPEPIERLRPDVPPAVGAIIRRLLAKRPQDRYQTPAELVTALDRRGTAVTAPPPRPAAHADPFKDIDVETVSSRAPTLMTPPPRKRWRGLPLIAAGGAVVGLLGLGAVVIGMMLRPPKPTAAPTQAAVTTIKPGETTINGLGMALIAVPPGRFLMGSPPTEPGRNGDEEEHEITIRKPYLIAAHEVTVGQFRTFLDETGYQTEAERSGQGAYRWTGNGWVMDPTTTWRRPGFAQTRDHPVVAVSWNDAVAFCDWLSKKENSKYALPTEAQWEYACRAGARSAFGFDGDARQLSDHAWFDVNAEGRTHPVGEKKANAWGLFDMLGNAREWTADWYAGDFYRKSPREDPIGPADGNGIRTVRGGSWYNDADVCRAARRLGTFAPTDRGTNVGFRVVLQK